MTSFHSQLLSKALELYPSLTEEDLKPYLLRSRATNAYDAVTLLAQSVGVAFDQARGENYVDSSQIQLALEKVYMVIDYVSNIIFSLTLRIFPSLRFSISSLFVSLPLNHSLTYTYTHYTHTYTHIHTHEQCEYCRLHSGCFLNSGNKMSQCMDVCNPYFTAPKRFTNISTSNIDFAGLRTNYLLHSFGQVFYSQFTSKITIIICMSL